jgi:hypothetical protein
MIKKTLSLSLLKLISSTGDRVLSYLTDCFGRDLWGSSEEQRAETRMKSH